MIEIRDMPQDIETITFTRKEFEKFMAEFIIRQRMYDYAFRFNRETNKFEFAEYRPDDLGISDGIVIYKTVPVDIKWIPKSIEDFPQTTTEHQCQTQKKLI